MITPLRHVTVLGTSKPQAFQILNDGEPFDAGGYVPTIEFRPVTGVDYSPVAAEWVDAAQSTVRVTGAASLPVGQHRFRFKLTGGGVTEYAPSDTAESSLWTVVAI